MIPISPHHSPQVRPNPQHGISLPPPFRTPPVSPFSHPMNTEYLPPPLQPLPPMMSMTTPPSPTNGRYERILPKQQTPSTSVFSVPMTPSNASSVMQHHNSVIHPPFHHHRVSLGGAATGANGDKQLTTADQRELARKVSHSAIERRRRERINDKIMQLKELIPSCADQDHLHKLSILQSAIEYIQYLQDRVTEKNREENSSGDSEERFTKRSKFDRYEIPTSKRISVNNSEKSEYKRKNISDKSSGSEGDVSTSTETIKKTTDASTNTDSDAKSGENIINHEEANTLLLLSKSNSTTIPADNDKEIPKTRDVEIQTLNETIEIEDDKRKEESGRVTVQQLLCN
ncbi:hypothetical protein C1645_716012 [Glomus cerebriforme]|uniref:BHLH domain-containing protein n=1 Tax=Glomus cerebriforme TaxID=658196 RepID=A0A397SCV9_9GLOM|nr:hypothetical protein C1645_716012 [Glomus cerebriforme]